MIVIRVELWPMGNAKRARELCRMALWNMGPSRNPDRGKGKFNYGVAIAKSAHHGARRSGVWKAGQVVGYPRGSKRVGVWDLLRSALNAALAGRPKYEGLTLEPPAARKVVEQMTKAAAAEQPSVEVSP